MKYIYLLFTIFTAHLSFADAWDNLTFEEAEAVVAELEKTLIFLTIVIAVIILESMLQQCIF